MFLDPGQHSLIISITRLSAFPVNFQELTESAGFALLYDVVTVGKCLNCQMIILIGTDRLSIRARVFRQSTLASFSPNIARTGHWIFFKVSRKSWTYIINPVSSSKS